MAEVLKRFNLEDFEKSHSKAWPNLNKIAKALVDINATDEFSAVIVSELSNLTGIHRNQINNLIKWRPGFVKVRSIFSKSVRYFYNPEFYRAAKPFGQHYPQETLRLSQSPEAAVAELLISEVTGEPKEINADIKAEGPVDGTLTVEFRYLPKDILAEIPGIVASGIVPRVKSAIENKDPTELDRALVSFLSLRQTIEKEADNIEFWN